MVGQQPWTCLSLGVCVFVLTDDLATSPSTPYPCLPGPCRLPRA
jgi:hypothetical protein